MEENQENFANESKEDFTTRVEAELLGKKGESGDNSGSEGGDFVMPLNEEMLTTIKELGVDDLKEDYFKKEDGGYLDNVGATKKLINDLISSAKKNATSDDKFIADYLNAKKDDNFSVDNYVKTLREVKNIDEKSNEDYLRAKLKEKKYSDSDIEEYFERTIKIEVDQYADKLKDEDKKALKVDYDNELKIESEKLLGDTSARNLAIEEAVTKYAVDNLNTGKFPLKIGESEMKGMQDGMFDLVKKQVTKVDGKLISFQEIDNVLADNDILFQILPFIHLAKIGKLNSTLSEGYKGIKNSEYEKIIENSGVNTGGDKVGGTNFNKFFGK